MKAICDRSALNEALSVVTSVIPTRTPKPILQCVRVTAAKDGLTLTAYDQDVGVRYRLTEVEVDKPGETLASADRFSAIVRESSDETMALECAGDLMHVRGRDSHFQINVQKVNEFPPVPDFEGTADFKASLGELAAAIDRTAFAAAKEATRYALNGVLFERKARKLQLVATDGRRLASHVITLEKGATGDSSAIIPLKTLSLISKLRRSDDDTLEVKMNANQALFRAPRATISSVIIDGNFPRYEDVIPRDCDRTAELSTQEFASAVRRAALLTTEESRGIRLSFTEDTLTLSGRVPEQGEATVQTEVRFKGLPLDVGFNPVFLLDVLKVCGDTITFELKDASKPSIIRSGPDFLYVIMPVSLS